jgi:tRNA nucleotidyltransferase (CCA-adding enzyme)
VSDARWEHFDHGSDIGVRGIAASVEAAFEQAALALTAVCVDPSAVADTIEVELTCEAANLELLLVAWLDSVVYEMSVRRMLFSRYALQPLVGGQTHVLRARAFGEHVDVRRHAPAVEIKGATLCALSVHVESGQWVAQCVLDV